MLPSSPGQSVGLLLFFEHFGPVKWRRAIITVLIGGEPLDGRRFMRWNFVHLRQDRIMQASKDREPQRMPRIEGETEWIPLPRKRL